MPINWILGHKPQQSPTCPQRQFTIYSTLISVRIMCPQKQYYAFLFDDKILFSHS